MCLVETHEKYEKIIERENIEKHVSRRKIEEKKGGGIMILKKKDSYIKVEKILEEHPDILLTKCQAGNLEFILAVIYISCNPKENVKIYETIDRLLNKYEENPMMIIGDMNAHTNMIIKDKINKNGEKLIEWLNRYNLILLNNDIECKGKYTWEARNSKSVIDYSIVNEKLYHHFKQMDIDESKEIIDLSDHMMLQVTLKTIDERQHYITNLNERDYYISLNQEKLKLFNEKFEEKLKESETITLERFDEIIEEVSEKVLKTKIIKSRNREKGKIEPIWMNKEIKQEIKNRKKYNKLKRYCIDKTEKDYFESKYTEHKNKAKKLIKDEITKYEIKITEEIKADKSRKLWQNINYLRGKNKITKQNTKIYDEKGNIMQNVTEEIKKFWTQVYTKNCNNTLEKWANIKEDYFKMLQNEFIEVEDKKIHYTLQEHFDMIFEIKDENKYIKPMENPIIEENDLKQQIKKMKNKKSPGPDNIKIEIYKSIAENNYSCKRLLTEINKTIQNNEIPLKWKRTTTKLIEKSNKPTIKDFRPITLANNSYKICMGILRTKIEDHLQSNNKTREQQFGFTRNRRPTDSIYALTYAIYHSRKHNYNLIIISIDFKKAFDSIDRDELLASMTKHKIHPKAIDLIINVYNNEKTNLIKNDEIIDEIEITSGIKQDCNGSRVLSLLITYLIIDELNKLKIGLKTKQLKLNNLFFADDGILMAETREEAEIIINKLQQIGQKCGLQINKQKSCILMSNTQNIPQEICNIKTVNEFKYLGVMINSGKDIFKSHKEEKIRKSKQLANMMVSVTHRSTNRLLIGKTYWKCVVLPEILYGSDNIIFNSTEINQIQKSENQAYRLILQAPKYSANEILRSEIGSSTMDTRDKINKISYLKHLLETENELLSNIMKHDIERSITPFAKKINAYLNEININLNYIKTNKLNKIKEKIKTIDTASWKETVKNKTTLKTYLEFKNEIKEEKNIYDNTEASNILFKTRSNTLKLNWRNRYNKDKSIQENIL